MEGESPALIFSQQYSQVLLNEDENLKCLKSKTKAKIKKTIYIDVITNILKIHFFLLFTGYNSTTKVRNLLVYIMSRIYYTAIERLRNYINDASLFYP